MFDMIYLLLLGYMRQLDIKSNIYNYFLISRTEENYIEIFIIFLMNVIIDRSNLDCI